MHPNASKENKRPNIYFFIILSPMKQVSGTQTVQEATASQITTGSYIFYCIVPILFHFGAINKKPLTGAVLLAV
jgi:hypothetical protein